MLNKIYIRYIHTIYHAYSYISNIVHFSIIFFFFNLMGLIIKNTLSIVLIYHEKKPCSSGIFTIVNVCKSWSVINLSWPWRIQITYPRLQICKIQMHIDILNYFGFEYYGHFSLNLQQLFYYSKHLWQNGLDLLV